jgi:hypothetical protein
MALVAVWRAESTNSNVPPPRPFSFSQSQKQIENLARSASDGAGSDSAFGRDEKSDPVAIAPSETILASEGHRSLLKKSRDGSDRKNRARSRSAQGCHAVFDRVSLSLRFSRCSRLSSLSSNTAPYCPDLRERRITRDDPECQLRLTFSHRQQST